MSRKHDRLNDLEFAFEQYKKSGHGDWLSSIIRIGGATNIPWPVGMAEAVADLIDKADPWTNRDQTHADDTWIFYVYWRETEARTGKKHRRWNMAGIRAVEEWFNARGAPKPYETIRTRLKDKYKIWRSQLSDTDLARMREAAGGGEKK